MGRVLVTGVGFISSIGNDWDQVTQNLRELNTGIEPYPLFADDHIPIKLSGTIKDFKVDSTDPEDWEYPREYKLPMAYLRSMSPHALYSHCALEQAIRSAGLTEAEVSNPQTGFYTASVGSPKLLNHHLNWMFENGVERLSPKAIVTTISGTLNFNFVAKLKIKGTSCGFTSACASSGHALGFAYDDIATGRQDRMIVVGAEDGNVETILPFAAMRALSSESEPEKAACPFDVSRNGFVGTGGATALILESEEAAKARGAEPLAEFAGWGQSSDGYSTVLPEPSGDGLIRAMEIANNSSGVNPDEIDYVNAHAPSTVHGDLAEMKALEAFLGDSKPRISSTKSLTGHGLSLSSILEAGISIVSLVEGFCPGTAHLREIDPAGANLNILKETSDYAPQVVLSNSSGFGGANVSLIFRKP